MAGFTGGIQVYDSHDCDLWMTNLQQNGAVILHDRRHSQEIQFWLSDNAIDLLNKLRWAMDNGSALRVDVQLGILGFVSDDDCKKGYPLNILRRASIIDAPTSYVAIPTGECMKAVMDVYALIRDVSQAAILPERETFVELAKEYAPALEQGGVPGAAE